MTVAADFNRLRWRCRRGMKEIDLLLEAYLREQYAAAASDEQATFVRLLELPDPDLASFLLGRSQPEDDAIAALIARIVPPQPAAP